MASVKTQYSYVGMRGMVVLSGTLSHVTLASGVDWGNVPAWAGSILAGVSVILAFSIIIRDRRKAEREQAQLVSYWMEQSGSNPNYYSFGIRNSNKTPIFDPRIIHDLIHPREDFAEYGVIIGSVKSFRRRWGIVVAVFEQRQQTGRFADPPKRPALVSIIKPDAEFAGSMLIDEEDADRHHHLTFRDSNGKPWLRCSTTGNLLRGINPGGHMKIRDLVFWLLWAIVVIPLVVLGTLIWVLARLPGKLIERARRRIL